MYTYTVWVKIGEERRKVLEETDVERTAWCALNASMDTMRACKDAVGFAWVTYDGKEPSWAWRVCGDTQPRMVRFSELGK